MSDGLIYGHTTLADWLWLVAAIVFAVEAVLIAVERKAPAVLVPIGLALVAVGWLVL